MCSLSTNNKISKLTSEPPKVYSRLYVVSYPIGILSRLKSSKIVFGHSTAATSLGKLTVHPQNPWSTSKWDTVPFPFSWTHLASWSPAYLKHRIRSPSHGVWTANSSPQWAQGRSPGKTSRDEVLRKLKNFCIKSQC